MRTCIVLEGLVVSIQTTRLVLFEFFTRFLPRAGRAFDPLAAAALSSPRRSRRNMKPQALWRRAALCTPHGGGHHGRCCRSARAAPPRQRRGGRRACCDGAGRVRRRVATGLAALGAGFAVAKVGTAALGALAEKPELFGRVLVLVGLAEGIAIYGLIVSILILNRLG